MNLETERLWLMPLTAAQLRLWVENLSELEREFAVSYQAEPIEGFFREIVTGQIAKTAADEANYVYHSFWFLVRKLDRVVVGSADFKDVPNELGEVEVGYGLGKEFEHNGYMTEAVRAMCAWALKQPKVKCVTAETEADNPASQNVLMRCGFALYKQSETLWWHLLKGE